MCKFDILVPKQFNSAIADFSVLISSGYPASYKYVVLSLVAIVSVFGNYCRTTKMLKLVSSVHEKQRMSSIIQSLLILCFSTLDPDHVYFTSSRRYMNFQHWCLSDANIERAIDSALYCLALISVF